MPWHHCKHQWNHLLWCAKISAMCKDFSLRSQRNTKVKNQFFSGNWVWTSDSRRLGKWGWTSAILSLRAECAQNDREYGMWLDEEVWLKLRQRRQTLFRSFVPKRKAHDYCHKTQRGLGYISTPIPLTSESEDSLNYDHSLGTSSWESDVSVGGVFKELSVNMASTSHPEEDEEMIQSDTNFWINTWTLSEIFALNNVNHPQRTR